MSEDNNNLFFLNGDDKPLYERPGRLDPDRNVPITRQSRVDVNVHYDETQKTFIRDSESPEFTEQSVNAMDPFEDSALLKGDVKPKVVGIRKNAPKVESKIFVPETDVSDVRRKVRTPVFNEPEQPLYIAEEDAAASTDYIADAMSGVDNDEETETKAQAVAVDNLAKLKMYALLLGVVIVLETAGIGILIALF
ncbi:MAG: hypothetical protein IKE09_00560 [Clostridiales bacterium]|nr:hypothetical protein [Clostridiales bacterium]